MADKSSPYGVLKGTVTGHLRDADDDHYQILVSAGSTMFRIAVNVHSSLKPPDLLFQRLTVLPPAMRNGLKALPVGFKQLPSKPGSLAQDFVRGGIVKTDKFNVVPGNVPGADNDLKDTMESAVIAAVGQKGALVHAFGMRWGPETKKDQYFRFAPGNGIHDIHMNQGNDKAHMGDDGVLHEDVSSSNTQTETIRRSSWPFSRSPSIPTTRRDTQSVAAPGCRLRWPRAGGSGRGSRRAAVGRSDV